MPVFFSYPAVCATALHCFSSSSPAIRQSQHSSQAEQPRGTCSYQQSRFPVPMNKLCLFTASLPQLGLFIISRLFIANTTDGTDNAKHVLSPHLRRRRGGKLSRKKREQMHKAACNQEPVTMPTEAYSKECVG